MNDETAGRRTATAASPNTAGHPGWSRGASRWCCARRSEFYRDEAWRDAGFTSLEDFLHRFWEAYFLPMDPNNLICQGWKWRHGDVSRHTNGDLAAALGRIKAKTLVVPFSHDMFFPPDDCEAEQRLIPNSRFRVVQTLWAHFAMFCMTRSDREQIDACIGELLNEPA